MRTNLRLVVAAAALLGALAPLTARAEVVSQALAHEHAGAQLESVLFYDDALEGPRPGVLVFPEWWGRNGYVEQRARQLAELGYVALAVDLYGKGKVTDDPQQAGAWAGALRGDVPRWRGRLQGALELLRAQPQVKRDAVAAIGFCFGGTSALQLAYSGADLRAVVSFHGNLPAPTAAELDAIRAELQVHHGAADSFVPDAEVQAFQQALKSSPVKWTFLAYSQAVHSFTNPEADSRGMQGVKYDARAAQRSWAHMRTLFEAIFGG